jgi:hypothetical protein
MLRGTEQNTDELNQYAGLWAQYYLFTYDLFKDCVSRSDCTELNDRNIREG